jgi:predicted transcriptional regulator
VLRQITTVQFALESVSTLPWNDCPVCRGIRVQFGLEYASQEAFADKSGFARSYMSRIERGLANPSLTAVEALADALRVKAKELF